MNIHLQLDHGNLYPTGDKLSQMEPYQVMWPSVYSLDPLSNFRMDRPRFFKFGIRIVHDKYYPKAINAQTEHRQTHVTIFEVMVRTPYL